MGTFMDGDWGRWGRVAGKQVVHVGRFGGKKVVQVGRFGFRRSLFGNGSRIAILEPLKGGSRIVLLYINIYIYIYLSRPN